MATSTRAAQSTTRAKCGRRSRRWNRLLAANKGLPLNVRVLFEGEEEVGGEGIAAYVASKPADLKADFALVSDTDFLRRWPADAVRRPARHDLHRA